MDSLPELILPIELVLPRELVLPKISLEELVLPKFIFLEELRNKEPFDLSGMCARFPESEGFF